MKLRWLSFLVRGRRGLKLHRASGFVQQSYQGIGCNEGHNYARNTCANGLGTNTFAGLDAVNREGHRNGLLKNVYPDNFLNINLAGAFPW